MSTQSFIAIKELGYPASLAAVLQFRAIYCHWDGYPAHNGNILLRHYSSTERVRALLDLGDLAVLGPLLGQPHNSSERWRNCNHPAHRDGWCLSYARDRQPAVGVTPRIYHDFRELTAAAREYHAQYLYLWAVNRWFFGATSMVRESELRVLDCYTACDIPNCPISSEQPLIAADWLEEHGQEDKAEILRRHWSGPPPVEPAPVWRVRYHKRLREALGYPLTCPAAPTRARLYLAKFARGPWRNPLQHWQRVVFYACSPRRALQIILESGQEPCAFDGQLVDPPAVILSRACS